MRHHTGDEKRIVHTVGALLLTLAVLSVPVTPATAQSGDDTGPVVTQLEGIRAELKSISQVTLLMTRIRLKQQRLGALESQLREARGHQEEMEQEIEHMEAIAQSYFEGHDSGDFDADPLNDTQQKELEFMRQQKSNLQTRLQTQRAVVIDLENDLMRAREDVLALEETVDEQLGLR